MASWGEVVAAEAKSGEIVGPMHSIVKVEVEEHLG
jgi:hypothetical protein